MRCPICKAEVPDAPNAPGEDDPRRRYFPFCSDRCKLIDLGRWLSGRYQIPVRDDEDDDERSDGVGEAPPPTTSPPPTTRGR